MKDLITHIQDHATYLGSGILKADGFINHQLLPSLTAAMGQAFARAFSQAGVTGVTRIVTAEVSGIAPALTTAMAMDLPMVFARKKRPAFMTGPLLCAGAISRTKAEPVQLHISADYLKSDDRVLIIDDFLATGSTLEALVSIVEQSGAVLAGIGCVIEKRFENGRARLEHLHVPVIALARVDLDPLQQSICVS
ncbi:MAG: xanthine phosphoribosyltransferase [Pseudomonadota bacterium]